MNEMNKDKKCIRCKEEKLLIIGNFKRRAPYLDFSPPFDDMCRKCRDKQHNKDRIRREYHKSCLRCSKEFMASRKTGKYCSKECKMQTEYKKKREETKRSNKLNKNKEINPKWLVRGRIHGVDY